MKRLITLFCMGVVVLMPFVVKAADTDVPGGEVIWDCPKSCKVNGKDKCQTTCSLAVKANVDISIDTITGTITKNSDVVQTNVEVADGWKYNSLGDNVTFTANPAKVGKKIDVAKITFEYDRDIKDCSITFTSEVNGDESSVDLPTDNNAPTGASLPIILLLSAVGVAGVLYFVSKKNTKMHRI